MEDYYARLRNDKGYVKVDPETLHDLSSENSHETLNSDSDLLSKLKSRKTRRSNKQPEMYKSDVNNKFGSMYNYTTFCYTISLDL